MISHREAEVLRAAGVALRGRRVGLWEVTEAGSVQPLAVDRGRPLPDGAVREFNAALAGWKVDLEPGRRWVGSRLDSGRWCIAPVRTEVPGGPPGGIERRRPERLILALAAIALGQLQLVQQTGIRV
ncbi:MAG TPA: hypothetical protein VNL98_09680 [Gemmatimonadales bacterium]|nr:hypothetical protein [Gemmatimonadales bacterium]